MTTRFLWLPLVGTALLAVVSSSTIAHSARGLPVNQRLVSFADVDYPAAARIVLQQGVVVVDVRLDDKGVPSAASALTGPDLLIAAAIENAKKWRFEANEEHRAIIVYDFTVDDAACHDRSRSVFLLKHSNFAQIVTCTPVVER
jgi:hypothetical protein